MSDNMSDLNPINLDAIDLGDLFGEIGANWELPELPLFDLGDLVTDFDLDDLLADFDLTLADIFPHDPALQSWLDDLTKGCDINLPLFDFPDLGDMARLWEGSDPCGNLAMRGAGQKVWKG